MNKPTNRFLLKPLSLAIFTGLFAGAAPVLAEEEDNLIEEVVATGTRLKGTAAAVLEERKNQAFVADIMGAEQISRTGDGNAAAALRRVTGLTLVDGKFIYVRGLGERYSSTQLNGATVPSPDPTRNVIPLDLFPSSIIESLSVQKGFSPSMPAAFGGGNVDIRLKSIPNELIFNVTAGIGYNSENSDNGLGYSGGDNDWYGADDGTRAAPQAIQNLFNSVGEEEDFFDGVSNEETAELFSQVNRNVSPRSKDINPDARLNLTVGNTFDLSDDWRTGFLIATGYNSNTRVTQGYRLQQADRIGTATSPVRFFDEVNGTEYSTRWSGLTTVGLEYDRKHRIDYTNIVLSDTSDEITEMFGNTENLNISEGVRVRDIRVDYEERKLYVNQLKGKHTFEELNFLGFDWMYSKGRSSRKAPGNMEARFLVSDTNEDGIFDRENEMTLSGANTAGRYTYQTLHDDLENYGYNFNLPVSFGAWESEFKFGANFLSKERNAENRRFDVNTLAFRDRSVLRGSDFGAILNDDLLANASLTRPVIRDTTIGGDDYLAAQKIDAYYFEADMFWDNTWRISGGVRWEDFRQVVVPFVPQTGEIDIENPESASDLAELAFQEDKLYPSLAVTYLLDDSMQFRASYSETVVRPDLREISSATYLDPLTEQPIQGTPGLLTTNMKNYDLRWEWYRDDGNSFSVGLFYKDMTNPIESVQSPAQDGPPLIRIANAETGSVSGVEIEFLQGLDVIGMDAFFLSGNVTLSDSEIELDKNNIVEQTGVSAAITNTTRRMTGHSEYVVNLQLGYDSDNGEHSGSLIYNVFGERILTAGIDGFDDDFEQPFHSLDMVYKYYPNFQSTITFKVQNILDEQIEIRFEDTLRQSETRGTGVSLSYKYEF